MRESIDFVELVSARTELRRAGPSSYEGLCPFHDERTPSFGIDPVQKVYYCFGCQAKGDVFTFVQETEGVDFKAALELLADRCGIELQREAEDPREAERRRRRERLLELLGRTAAYYERRCGRPPRHIARGSICWDGVSPRRRCAPFASATPPAPGIGCSWPRAARDSPSRALRDGARAALASRMGACMTASAGASCSRWPTSAAGCWASVRARWGRNPRSPKRPKYLNTSDNDLYHKGLHLYGADLARSHATRAGGDRAMRGLHRCDRRCTRLGCAMRWG